MDLFGIVNIEETKRKYNITDYTLVDFLVGFDDCIYVLFSKKPPERIDGCFVNTHANTKYAVVMIIVDWVKETTIHTEYYELGMHSFNYNFVRPFKTDLLLVGSRCAYLNENNFEKNGIILDRNGSVKYLLCFGDGINDVITDSHDRIITSYFDEGISGNYGWRKPIGKSGLVVWNDEGIPIWENEKYNICDCYAINIDSSDNLWFYYYTEFNLVKTDFKNDTVMHPDIKGCCDFAISETQRKILFQGGYGEKSFYCCDLDAKNGNIGIKKKIIITADGKKINTHAYCFNNSRLLFITEDGVLRGYRFFK